MRNNSLDDHIQRRENWFDKDFLFGGNQLLGSDSESFGFRLLMEPFTQRNSIAHFNRNVRNLNGLIHLLVNHP